MHFPRALAAVVLLVPVLIGAPAAAYASDDVCSNLGGAQSVPPDGYVSLVDGTCVQADLGAPPVASSHDGASQGSAAGGSTAPTVTAPSVTRTPTATPRPDPTASASPSPTATQTAATVSTAEQPPHVARLNPEVLVGLGALLVSLLAAAGAGTIYRHRRSLR